MDNKKFKVGDRVRYKNRDAISKVVIAKDGWVAIDTPVMTAESCPVEDVEKIDTKDAFLFELQALLRKYDAEIEAYIGEDDETYKDKAYMCIQVGSDMAYYEGEDLMNFNLSADNIMDYDKE